MANETIGEWLHMLMPEFCVTEFFIKFNFFHVDCLKITLSKCLGYAIILGATTVKVPQIIKLFRSSSACGISVYSVLFDLLAITATAVYAIAHQFPFSSYGETVFLVIQTVMIACQVFYYNHGLQNSVMFLVSYGITLFYLLSPVVPPMLLYGLQAGNTPIVIVSRSLQLYENYGHGSTGELSAITVALLFLGSTARIFTSMQETGDTLVIFNYVAASVFNGLIAAQVVYYWNEVPQDKLKKH